MKRKLKTLLLAVLSCTTGWVAAQSYPQKPVKILVPFVAGGTSDIAARILGERLTKSLGQAVVVDNRPGAGGSIAAATTVAAAPDGYRIFLSDPGAYAINPIMQPQNAKYDPLTDFVPVGLVSSSPSLLVVHPTVAARSVGELLQLAKARPGVLNYSSAAPGTTMTDVNLAPKPVSASQSEMAEIVLPNDANPLGALLGGRLMHWIDLAGALAGTEVAKMVGAGLVLPSAVTQLTVVSALLSATVWNLITWYFGLPTSSSHALMASIVGAGIATAGTNAASPGGAPAQPANVNIAAPPRMIERIAELVREKKIEGISELRDEIGRASCRERV